jgi:pimeloyl-ACP methyl ester carboxylesterase
MTKHFSVFSALFWLATASFAGAPAVGGRIALKEYTHPHWLVEVQPSRHLNVYCAGRGSPTVILEAGGGDDSSSFRSVQLGISAFTRVCAYDRASIGFSDPAPWPSTALNTVADLHRLIRIISRDQPVILVGHSDGGLYAPLYAATYPNDVAGMVLIDPFTVGADRVATSLLTRRERASWYASDSRDLADARKCLELAQAGILSRPEARMSTCLDNPASPDKARHKVLNEQLARPSEQKALLTAWSIPIRHPIAACRLPNWHAKANPDFGSMPLIVLTAGR